MYTVCVCADSGTWLNYWWFNCETGTSEECAAHSLQPFFVVAPILFSFHDFVVWLHVDTAVG